MLSKKIAILILLLFLSVSVSGCIQNDNSNYADTVQAFAVNQNNQDEGETQPATEIISDIIPFSTAAVSATSEIKTTEIIETSEESKSSELIESIEIITETTEPAESPQLYVITPSGKKYHYPQCRYGANVKQYISKEEAEKSGYEPCKVCKPT